MTVTGNPINFEKISLDETFLKNVENTVNITISDTSEPVTPQFQYVVKEEDLKWAKQIVGMLQDEQTWNIFAGFFIANLGLASETLSSKFFVNGIEKSSNNRSVNLNDIAYMPTKWGSQTNEEIKAGDVLEWAFWSATANNFQLQNTDIWFIPDPLKVTGFMMSIGIIPAPAFWSDLTNSWKIFDPLKSSRASTSNIVQANFKNGHFDTDVRTNIAMQEEEWHASHFTDGIINPSVAATKESEPVWVEGMAEVRVLA